MGSTSCCQNSLRVQSGTQGVLFPPLLLICAEQRQLINDFITHHLCVLVHRRTMYICLELAVITGDCMAHGEDNGLMSISLFLKLPPLNSPSAVPTALQGQRLYNCNEKLEGNFNINEKNYIPRCAHS